MGRVASWFGASTGGRNGGVNSRAQHNSSSGVPDFLAQADDPDKRRIDHARAQSRGGKRLSGQSSPNIAAKFTSHLHVSSARLMRTRLTRLTFHSESGDKGNSLLRLLHGLETG